MTARRVNWRYIRKSNACRGLAFFVFVLGGFASLANASIWSNSFVPSVPQVTNDSASVDLGLKFYSDVPGTVTAVRFYKGSQNTGTHIGSLWSSNGTNLGSITFSGESASGWQQASFSSPISITANAVYVVSYLAPKGSYADDQSYSWSSVNASPLHVSGTAPGTYAYASSSAFPSSTWNKSNYYVDLVFVPASGSTPTTYSISGTVSGTTGATLTLSGTSSASTKTNSAGNYSFAGLKSGSYLVAPSQSGYTFTPTSASVSVTSSNITALNFKGAVVNPKSHTVSLSWVASTSANIAGYRVYRSLVSGASYGLLNTALATGTTFVDTAVTPGSTYYYVATAVTSTGTESGYSNESKAVVPSP
jgi:Domain of unknown function (DUF4082)/SdrD B-like domain